MLIVVHRDIHSRGVLGPEPERLGLPPLLLLLAEVECGQAAGLSRRQGKEWALYCKDLLGA